jgi:hypothetical protein
MLEFHQFYPHTCMSGLFRTFALYYELRSLSEDDRPQFEDAYMIVSYSKYSAEQF